MLPPQLRSSTAVCKHRLGSSNALRTSSISILRSSTAARGQSRSFWSGRRSDWTSHLDPIYQRYARVRTLKTRAKLLKNMKRRGAFEWDLNAKPFFTPRHMRWASHYSGRQWYTNDDPKQKAKEEATAEEGKREEESDGYELSKREKEWKRQMEEMRRRVAQDPYEAVFGRRFEPFWGPLLPSWMREELGLPASPKTRVYDARSAPPEARLTDLKAKLTEAMTHRATPEMESSEKQASPPPSDTSRHKSTIRARQSGDTVVEATPSSTANSVTSSKPFSRMTREERLRHVLNSVDQHSANQGTPQSEPTPKSYAYASSTSWDSVSNRTRKVEWDSTSNQTKKFEYDPISNRMVEVEAPNKVAIDSDSSAVRQTVGGPGSNTSRTVSESEKATGIPVKQSNDVRKSIPIPPPLSQPSHSITLGYTQTSVEPAKNTGILSNTPKPAALAKMPANDLDMLTADNVRASMGKTKQTQSGAKSMTAEQKAELEREFDSNARAQDAEVDAILKERAARSEQANTASAWDRAETVDMYEREVRNLQKKKDKLIKDEGGLFHIERQKRELQKLDDRIKAVTKRVDAMNLAVENVKPQPPQSLQTLQTSIDRAIAKQAAQIEQKSSPLQSSIDRMQSKDLPQALEQDLDDAAAHESTEPSDAHASVPRGWTKQADILQADRVKRTAAKRPYPMTKWADDMYARKVAYEHRKAEAKAIEDAKNAESNAKLDKINKMLEAEVAEQKFKMQAFEGRYAEKVKSLRGELDRTFKQSRVHSEKHVERIRELEAQLSGLKEKESKYADKVKSLRDELERAYKQSAVHAEKHLERIKYLEGELENAVKKPTVTETKAPEVLPAEGDVCVNAPSFSDNGKWYKRPANPEQPTRSEIEEATRKAQDQALVEEVRGIYENEYGVIDEAHEQGSNGLSTAPSSEKADWQARRARNMQLNKKEAKKVAKQERRAREAEEKARQVVEVESDVDLGEELAKYEREHPQAYRLEQSIAAPESAEKMKSVIADSLEKELNMPKAAPRPGSARVQWAEPPLYKVLAYDSGNDMMSTATTTTSVLPGSAEEQPLGIPEALSRLYQPARFVPYFAELQSDNFQAIAATREIIVFRQVKKAAEATETLSEGEPAVGLEDHGLESLESHLAKANKHTRKYSGKSSAINPIDGTSHQYQEPTTGNFASPTGFVNHDPVFPPEPKEDGFVNSPGYEATSDTYSTIAKEPTAKTSRQIWESLPGSNEAPVKRTEPVFSGMTRKQRKRMEREQQKQRERENPQGEWQYEEPERPEREGSKVLKYMLGAGLSTATVMYLVGALVEAERDPERQAERKRAEMRRAWEGERRRLEGEAERLAREWERR